MAAAWGANTEAGPPHLASIVTDVQWEGAEGGGGTVSNVSSHLGIRFKILKPCFFYIYIYLLNYNPKGRLNLTYILYKYPVRTAQ